MLFWVSKASTAALVISFSVPWVHCEVSSVGRPGQRHEKVPGLVLGQVGPARGGAAGGEADREVVELGQELLQPEGVAGGHAEGDGVRGGQGGAVRRAQAVRAAGDGHHHLGGGDEGGVEGVGQRGGVRLHPFAGDVGGERRAPPAAARPARRTSARWWCSAPRSVSPAAGRGGLQVEATRPPTPPEPEPDLEPPVLDPRSAEPGVRRRRRADA